MQERQNAAMLDTCMDGERVAAQAALFPRAHVVAVSPDEASAAACRAMLEERNLGSRVTLIDSLDDLSETFLGAFDCVHGELRGVVVAMARPLTL